MPPIISCRLSNGKTLTTRIVTYPAALADQLTLINLWRTAWSKANNCDWLEAVNGDYSDTLTITAVIGTIDDEPVGTASAHYPAQDPEAAVIGSVLTHPAARGLGIATHLTEAVTELAFAAGCKVAYLATRRQPNSMYLRCGFDWHNGGVMRSAVTGVGPFEQSMFAPGQATTIRPANWGDLPAMACLVVQPVDTFMLDYPRGYISGKHAPLGLCASIYPRVYDQVAALGGIMCTLIGDTPHRVLGYGSVMPGPAPAQQHLAVIDAVTHDHYADQLNDLIMHLADQARHLNVQVLQAFVAEPDQHKHDCFARAGFAPVGKLHRQLYHDDQFINVALMEKPLTNHSPVRPSP